MGIWCLNTNNTKRLLPKMRVNSMKRKRKKWPKKLCKKAQNRNQKKSFCKSPARNFFEPFHFQQEHTITKKKLHSILFGNWYHDSKTQKIYTTMLAFFSLL